MSLNEGHEPERKRIWGVERKKKIMELWWPNWCALPFHLLGCHSVSLVSARSFAALFFFVLSSAPKWLWFIHRNVEHNMYSILFGWSFGRDEYGFYSSSTSFCRRWFAFIWQHIIWMHSNSSRPEHKSNKRENNTNIDEAIVKRNFNSDIVLHSYSAPIDRSLLFVH